LALQLDGKPAQGVAVNVDLLQRISFSHRKRLVGGFYGYEGGEEIKRLQRACEGTTDDKGYLFCETTAPSGGEMILQARAQDAAGRESVTHTSAWVADKADWWFDASNDDRMDVIPERKRYEPGESAVVQVRMPFRSATALVTIEREGVLDAFVRPLSGKAPVLKVALAGNHAPNAFISVLAVRGRVAGVQPSALVDLGKPSFKMGIGEVQVGWKAHELKVAVSTDRTVFKAREKIKVAVQVTRAFDGKPVRGSEAMIAAVDEGLLELAPNQSWKLLDAMMTRRGIEVDTATAAMQVVGKRHYGRKALPPGGGGGRQSSRELFDTLLFWKARVKLDEQGRAQVEVPLNDSLTSFRIVAVAHGGAGLFGTGAASVRSTQDLQVLSGLLPLVREQDRFQARFTVRNASEQTMTTTLTARWTARADKDVGATLAVRELSLAAGEARDVTWDMRAPIGVEQLRWEVTAHAGDQTDRLKVTQRVIPAVEVRTFQSTIVQLERDWALPVRMPEDAIAGRGGVRVGLQRSLSGELAGVREFMQRYPYSCLEQRVSQAVALRDEARWRRIANEMMSFLDSDGLAKYFHTSRTGSEVLTAYVLQIAQEAGWTLSDFTRNRMEDALLAFVEGRLNTISDLPTADLSLRKIAALDALARGGREIKPEWLQSIAIEPNLWPTSAVLDWHSLLKRAARVPGRDGHLAQAEQILRARLNFQGTTTGFSTERSDYLWWLMAHGDVNANRVLLQLADQPLWKEDVPRLVRGTLGRQQRGHWSTTVANAWGVLAVEKFSSLFERAPVTGSTEALLAEQRQTYTWKEGETGGAMVLKWPVDKQTLALKQTGEGKPWVTLQSLAAIPLKTPLSSGFKIARAVNAIERAHPQRWSRGDVVRVRLDLESQADMTWVVVRDPVPAGASILGTGLARDSQILSSGEKKTGWVWPAFEERTQESFRAYYRFVPKGKWAVEYALRLNNPGEFQLPPTRVEAMYAPEMFGESPNGDVTVVP
ncbi:MAG: alpha-2-macroglobulin, partial [Betaproteobacteria bacterium]|nr:alpha-2-macroglobulin [Betaproteobacteria bacterium]